MKIREKYSISKSAKVGTECICPSCNSKFIKSSYQQAFCKTKGKTVCKDAYWNTVDPNKRNNTTRISPASRAWMEKMRDDYEMNHFYDEHLFSSEGLGQWTN